MSDQAPVESCWHTFRQGDSICMKAPSFRLVTLIILVQISGLIVWLNTSVSRRAEILLENSTPMQFESLEIQMGWPFVMYHGDQVATSRVVWRDGPDPVPNHIKVDLHKRSLDEASDDNGGLVAEESIPFSLSPVFNGVWELPGVVGNVFSGLAILLVVGVLCELAIAQLATKMVRKRAAV